MSPHRKPPLIPLFGQNTDHSSVPAKDRSAIARGGGQGRPFGRRDSASPLTAEHDNRLAISWDLDVRRCDAGSIDAAGWCSGGRAGGIDDAPPNGLANRDTIRSSSIELPAGCGRAPINSPMFLRVFSERSSHFGD
jgi:hypothetical protein